mgnify:CR=1 FL=1
MSFATTVFRSTSIDIQDSIKNQYLMAEKLRQEKQAGKKIKEMQKKSMKHFGERQKNNELWTSQEKDEKAKQMFNNIDATIKDEYKERLSNIKMIFSLKN